MERELDLTIKDSTYQWSVRLFSIVKKLLSVNVELHQHAGKIENGEIFLFNHFARFETFIPQYLIYQSTGDYCRSVASSEFFEAGDAFANYLLNLGAVPSNYDGLLPFLAGEILRGRKVIVFPEGGMVKDRRVRNEGGHYSVYSRTAEVRRKHHTGAAVLGMSLDAFKTGVLAARDAGHTRKVEAWAENLRMDAGALLAAARRPTTIIPSNITFYPIRVGDNFLRRGAEMLNRGLSPRLSEELLIEGNILLKETDMDIRLGDPVSPGDLWSWWERRMIPAVVRRLDSIDQVFELRPNTRRMNGRLLARGLRRRVLRLRDDYMHGMYAGVTINLSHLASSLIMSLVDSGIENLDQKRFHETLYLLVKNAQKSSSLHLHRGLRNPESYAGVVDGESKGLDQFLRTTAKMELVRRDDDGYHFLPKLLHEHEFDEVRMENAVAVYANEAAAVNSVRRAVDDALTRSDQLEDRELALLRFDDERISHHWDKHAFSKTEHEELNRQETATKSPAPYLLLPDDSKDLGVVLVHGFLSSPSEMRGLGDRLHAAGYPVVGVRLKGHGTSPWDLRERRWEDWLDSVRRGFRIMAGCAKRVVVVGFSTGAGLALKLASEQPAALAGVASVSAPLRFQNRNMLFVPLFYNANRIVRWASSFEGVMPFRPNNSEHPDVNYQHMPMRGLYELRRLVGAVDDCLSDVQCPVTIIQGDRDPVVDPRGAERIHAQLGSEQKTLQMVEAERHGILYEDLDHTQDRVCEFVESLL